MATIMEWFPVTAFKEPPKQGVRKDPFEFFVVAAVDEGAACGLVTQLVGKPARISSWVEAGTGIKLTNWRRWLGPTPPEGGVWVHEGPWREAAGVNQLGRRLF